MERALTLLGSGRPVIDGGGRGHVVEATAPLTLRGFVLRASGERVDTEDAGVMVRGARAVVEDNVLEDVFYGIYLKEAPGSIVRGNRIHGKPFPPPRRGDGIRLWRASGTRIVDNRVRGARDVVVYFSDSLRVRGNTIEDGRYGLHYMYSNHNRFEGNRFERNEVGAFIMYSVDIELRDNVFARSSGYGAGSSGMGLGLKDSDDVRVEGNLFVQDEVGVHLDNSPHSRDAVNELRENLFLYDGVAVRLLPSVRGNRIVANSFVANDVEVEVAGGVAPGQAGQNDWAGNYWSGYAGFDRNGDGIGDTPFVAARLVDDLLGKYPALRLFAMSPAMPAVDALSRFFPLLQPEPVAIDSTPTVRALALERWQDDPPPEPAP